MTPAFLIKADGADVTANFADRLVNLTIVDEAGQKSDTAEITLDDRDHRIALPEVGATLDIALGLGRSLIQMGRYVVDDISGELSPATLIISAKAADMLGDIRARKTRSWSNLTLGDLVARIASEHGLKPSVSASLSGTTYAYLAQTSESDLNLLTRLARDLDAVAKPAGGHLVFAQRGDGTAADGSTLPAFQVTRDQISSGNWSITGRGKYGRVTAAWGDLTSGTSKRITIGDKDPALELRHRFASEPEARRAAKAALTRSKRASGRLSIELAGFYGGLMAEAKVDVSGIKPELSGEWTLTRVQHSLGAALITRFDAERDNGA